MDNREQILQQSDFGSRIAEDDSQLTNYFVETEHWRKLTEDKVDIIFGAKGSGKSALYSLLLKERQNFRLDRRTLVLPAENPRGAPAFRDLISQQILSEESFRGLWKLYFLSISADYYRHMLQTSPEYARDDAELVIKLLEKDGLLTPDINLLSRLKAAFDYVLRIARPKSIEGSYIDPAGATFSTKITLQEPTKTQQDSGYTSVDTLLAKLNLAFQSIDVTVWLALDRLDIAFADSDDLEKNALRSLFRTYLDMSSLGNIKLKIFLRDDIWKKIVEDGFREASHITRTITLSWDSTSLLHLMVKRLAANEPITQYYSFNQANLARDAKQQLDFFYKIFPKQVDIGKRKPLTLDWMLTRTADGSKRTAPRELIHLLLSCREEQLKRYETGNAKPNEDCLFESMVIRQGLHAVSRSRYEQTLCAEYPSLKELLAALEGEKTLQDVTSLSKLWKQSNEQATSNANKLVETGFFERRGDKDTPMFWVPFLYRDALKMIQGTA